MKLNRFATFIFLAIYSLAVWEAVLYIKGDLQLWSYNWTWGWKLIIVLVIFYTISELVLLHTFMEDDNSGIDWFMAMFAIVLAPVALPIYLAYKIFTGSFEFKPSSLRYFGESEEDD